MGTGVVDTRFIHFIGQNCLTGPHLERKWEIGLVDFFSFLSSLNRVSRYIGPLYCMGAPLINYCIQAPMCGACVADASD